MESNLAEAILHVCKTFNEHAVEYLIVGGTAVALHGYFRHSVDSDGTFTGKPDIDIWYNPTYDNYFKVLNALETLGEDVKKFREEQMPDPGKSFFKCDFENFTLDLLPKLKAQLKFRQSLERKEAVTFQGIDVPFIAYRDLVLDKQTNPRPKDLDDIQQLEDRKKKS